VAAISFLIEQKTASGPFNLTAPNQLTNAEFGRILGRILRRPAFLPTPSLALRLAFGEMATVLLDGQHALPEKLQRLGYSFNYPEPAAAVVNLLSEPLVFRYKHRFQVQAPLEKVAEFHARSSSLTAITPPPTRMIVHQAPPRLAEGDEMDFTMKLGPLPIRWLARIENVRPTGFVDRQLRGPFHRWVHQHIFEPVDETTTTVLDEIEFSLHSQPWPKIIGFGMVLSLPALFAYRSWKTRALLEKKQAKTPQADARVQARGAHQ
jgi:ligand-binding SRPBCC domain-containing protein